MITRTLTNHIEKTRKIDIFCPSLFNDYRSPPPTTTKQNDISQNVFYIHTNFTELISYPFISIFKFRIILHIREWIEIFFKVFLHNPFRNKTLHVSFPNHYNRDFLGILTSHGQSLWVFRYASESFIFKIDILNVS